MTAVPSRPAADTRCTCGGTWPCTGPTWMGDHSPERITSADGVVAPDATAGDGLRDDCGHESWSGLMRLLDEHWPDDIFPTKYADDPKRDAGPRIVSLMRLVDKLRAERDDVLAAAARDAEKVRRVEELADGAEQHAAEDSEPDDPLTPLVFVSSIRRALDGTP